MNCSNIIDIAFSGKTMLWVILIVVNLGFLLIATLKYNPLETFSNFNSNGSIFNMFLKKLEWHSANKRNEMINTADTQYIEATKARPSFRQSENLLVIPSSDSDSSSHPKPIPRHHNNNNNSENNDEHNNIRPFNSHGFLGGIMNRFFSANRKHHHRRHHRNRNHRNQHHYH